MNFCAIQLTSFSVNWPTINVDKKPPNDDSVLAIPKMVPEKFGAMSKPLPKYPAVTAPLRNNWNVNMTTAQVRSYPTKICKIIKRPGSITANAVNDFRACVVVSLPVRRK